MVLLIELLDTFAKRIDKPGENMRYANMINASDYKNFKKPSDADTAPYYYIASKYNYASLYTEYSASPDGQEAKRDQLREKHQATRNALNEESLRAYNLRWEFIHEYTNAKAKKNKNVIIEYLLKFMMDGPDPLNIENFTDILEIEIKEDRAGEEWGFEDIAEKVAAQPELCLLVATYLIVDDERQDYFNYNNKHEENEWLDLCYEFLEKLGYQMSEKERQLQDGTHELFHVDEE